ncbi:MAG TPA: histidine phosphatase family protein [Caulobacterales bacterium]|nr:histidine phosphatase family protein [Caulobacterales bacterium]
MDVLILLRHGKAVREHEAEDDKSRGLTDRGRRQAAEAGAALAKAGLAPDRILVSGALRTRQTYAALASCFTAAPTFLDALYMARAETVWDEAVRAGGKAVLVIGHNPGLHDLAADLAGQSNDHSAQALGLRDRFPTSAYAAFSIAGPRRTAAAPRLLSAWAPSS